jgi:hypothetical protein
MDKIFQPGDRVRCVVPHRAGTRHYGARGDLATVLSRWNAVSCWLAFDRDKGTNRPECFVSMKRFELVEQQAPAPVSVKPLMYVSAPPVTVAPGPTSKTWIIIVRDAQGVLQPARHPRPYISEKQAHAVAKTMAERHRGSTFMVFEATGFVHVPKEFVTEVIKL